MLTELAELESYACAVADEKTAADLRALLFDTAKHVLVWDSTLMKTVRFPELHDPISAWQFDLPII